MDEHKLEIFEGRVLMLGLTGNLRRLERVWVMRRVICTPYRI